MCTTADLARSGHVRHTLAMTESDTAEDDDTTDESTPPTRLILVRHGESEVTVRRVLGGERSCTGLSELGRRQATALGERLAAGDDPPIDVVWSSTLERAVETADIVAAHIGIDEVHRDRDLVERRPGEADGLTFTEFRERYGLDFLTDPYEPLSPGGESAAEFHLRAGGAVARVASTHPGKTVLVVCHGGVIDVAFRDLLDLPRHGGFDLWTLNTSLTELTLRSDLEAWRWRLVRYNDAAHLAGLPDQTPHAQE